MTIDVFDFIQFFYQESNLQYSGIDLDNGLALVRRQAIIWINGGLVFWCIYVSLSLNELKQIWQ